MNKIFRFVRSYKILLFGIVFTLLMYSIVKDVHEIILVSSTHQNKCVPIIMYHQVKNTNLGKDVISPYEFESDLKYLKDNNYTTITMEQLIKYVYEDEELPPNPIILSFDDGYLSTYRYVYPLLQEYDMKIVLSIIGKSIDDFSKVSDNHIEYAYITWDQVQEMGRSGNVEVQNHTYNLHKVKNGRYGCYQKVDESLMDYEQLLTEDISKLQVKIDELTDKAPNTFTYPYGKYNDNTETVIKKLGFKASLSCTFGVNLISKDNPDKLFGLKRICRSHNKSIDNMISEGLKTLKYISE
ncbi:MAG: polysaccharide deacetylase [Firmicutes bacterium]|nr:polysaccharide deacetylase [Bacillota bacterium]